MARFCDDSLLQCEAAKSRTATRGDGREGRCGNRNSYYNFWVCEFLRTEGFMNIFAHPRMF